MSSKREQILSAIEAALQGTTDRIYRSRSEAISRNESPALVIEPAGDSPLNPEEAGISFCRLDWRLTVRIGIIVRGSVPDRLADPICVAIHQRLMSDTLLAGLTMNVYPGPVSWEIVDADTPAGVVICDWTIAYRTSVGDISV